VQRRADLSGWQQVRPVLIVLAVVVFAVAVAVILLQSAGVIHLPFLGGGTPSSFAVPTTSG
jgi:hypothetical protein